MPKALFEALTVGVMAAIRNSDELAESLGINLARNKLLSFLLSVFYAGLAGGLGAGVHGHADIGLGQRGVTLRDLVNAIPYYAIKQGLLTVAKQGKKNILVVVPSAEVTVSVSV